MSNLRFTIGDPVWKRGAGYEGPGEVVSVFQTWMGDWRYVVAHRVAGGRGFFYHIYSAKELERDTGHDAGRGADAANVTDPTDARSIKT